MNANTLPEGYMLDSQGRLTPVEMIAEIDKLRDTMVKDIVAQARTLQDQMTMFKSALLDDIQAFIQLSAEKYGAKVGGNKGNVVLTSYDGKFQVRRQVAETLVFDERLQVAKEMVDECITRWAADSNAHIRALVQHAFKVDKRGQINTGAVISLTKLQIDDTRWKQAMAAIIDSIQVSGTRTYVRIYERVGSSEKYLPIVLDLAAL